MTGLRNIALVIPAYNVAGQIGDVLSQVLEWIPRKSVCVVDDGSSDDTREQAVPFGILFLRHPRNRGKGEALKTGFRACLSMAADAVFTLDGDGQHDPARIPEFLEVASRTGCDLVVGKRPFRLGEMPPDRIFSNRTSSMITSLAAGRMIADSQCGYRLYGRAVLESVHAVTSRYEMETEMLIRASRMGFRIGWCPFKTGRAGRHSGGSDMLHVHASRFYVGDLMETGNICHVASEAS
jgi:glycosyltransferase involved in cell wall biosynthesis